MIMFQTIHIIFIATVILRSKEANEQGCSDSFSGEFNHLICNTFSPTTKYLLSYYDNINRWLRMREVTPTQDPATGSTKCPRKCVTVPLFLLNLITWICGGALIGLGIWVINTEKDYKYFAEIQNVYIVYMALSAVLFTTGIFGACGVLASNKLLLKLYILLICLVFGTLLGLIIFTAVQRSFVEKYLVKQWNETSDDTRKYLQKEFDCCGITKDVIPSHKSNYDNSCFVNTTTYERKQDCLGKLKAWFEDNQTIMAAVGSSVIVVMIILMLSTCWVIQNINKHARRNQVVPLQSNRKKEEDNNCEMVEVEQTEACGSTSGKKWAKHSSKF